jgi:hypothetical protein
MLDIHQRPQQPQPPSGHERAWTAKPSRRGAILLSVALAPALLGACGSSSPQTPNAEIERTCRQVEAVLSDGPEPAADPVGYAQAQVLPLRQIHTSDRRLHEAISRLAGAYDAFASEHRAGSAAESAVSAAAEGVNAICPGAAS